MTLFARPHPGQKIRLDEHEYTIDRIEVANQRERRVNIWITDPAVEDFDGKDHSIEPGWRRRVEAERPDCMCFM